MTNLRPFRLHDSVFRILAALLVVLALAGCAPLFSHVAADPDALLIQPVPGSGAFTYSLEVSSLPRDVYFVFSASADKDNYAVPTAQTLSVDGMELPIPEAMKLPSEFGIEGDRRQRIADFNRNPWAALGTSRVAAVSGKRALEIPAAPRASYTPGISSDTFKDDVSSWPSTCRYVSDPVTVAVDGTPRRLVIWVANDSWYATGTKAHLVTQAMVDWLADKFLAVTEGADNDVFDWLTTILGAEWGDTPYVDLIEFNGDIHILLADIENDNSDDGGIVGYFWSLNNFRNAYLPAGYAGLSNERVMFVLDSVMFANPEGGGDDAVWSPSDYWALELYSTLTHEFQHMISFYQRQIVRDSYYGADVWIEELCSLLAEDLLAERMGVPGPRGVDASDGTAGSSGNTEGRMPLFNRYSYFPLVVTGSYDVFDYSTGYAFGAWLARNYGGAGLLRRLVHSSASDESLVEAAVAADGISPSDLDTLLGRWAAAVLCSDRENMPAGYQYNRGGWFTSTLDGETYRLGSLDAFRYYRYGTSEPGPYVFTSEGPVGQGRASSNVFFQAAQGFTGTRSFEINLPDGVRMYAVLK